MVEELKLNRVYRWRDVVHDSRASMERWIFTRIDAENDEADHVAVQGAPRCEVDPYQGWLLGWEVVEAEEQEF